MPTPCPSHSPRPRWQARDALEKQLIDWFKDSIVGDCTLAFKTKTNKSPDGVFQVTSSDPSQPNQLFIMEAKLNALRYGDAAKQLKMYKDVTKDHPQYASSSITKVWAPYHSRAKSSESFRSMKHQAAQDSIKIFLRKDSLTFESLWAEGSETEGSAEIDKAAFGCC